MKLNPRYIDAHNNRHALYTSMGCAVSATPTENDQRMTAHL
jgi:hypothetical protein